MTESAESLKVRGNNALARGAPVEAEVWYRMAIARDPDYMPAHYNLGNALRMQGRLGPALESYRAAASLAPNDYEIRVNIGVTLNDSGDYTAALESFDAALQLAPRGVEARVNRAIVLAELGRHDDAVSVYDAILADDPSLSLARYFRSIEYLLLGRWKEGFQEHESRLDLPGVVPTGLLRGTPAWDGQPLAGRTLLIYPEQGLGDMIHFLRYVSVAKARGARVLVCCQPALLRLLAACPHIDRVFEDGTPVPEPFDCHVSVMSLPAVLGVEPGEPPLQFRVPVRKTKEIAEASGLKVGICSQGNAAYRRDRARSIPAAVFSKGLEGVPGVFFFNVTLDRAPPLGLPLAPQMGDLLDTAALLRQLDLVVTTDTSIPHLAGSLGVPTWCLLGATPDWRWGLSGDATPWYPGMRLFRQQAPGDWTALLARVREALSAKAAETALAANSSTAQSGKPTAG